MIVQQRLPRLKNAACLRRLHATMDKHTVAIDRTGRLIQIFLALYLIPVLLVVLAVGGLGMLVLGIGQAFTGPARQSLG